MTRERVVILTWDPTMTAFWLLDYFPEIVAIDAKNFPAMAEYPALLGPVDVLPVMIPHDCTDGFLGAYWRRPEKYLDAGVRGAISTFTKLADVERGLTRLRQDLVDGSWTRRHGHLMAREQIDLGYRLVVSGRPAGRRGSRG